MSRTAGLFDLQIDTSSEDTGTFTGDLSPMTVLTIGKLHALGTTVAYYVDDIQIDVQKQYFETDETVRYLAIGED